MKNTKMVFGIMAHVDAGKTTLSEALLYHSGSIRKMGRVDNQDAFLDNYVLERERGITIFSKQAQIKLGEQEITLLDTPGHVDFSAEMERTLQVLDYAILVVSGADGVQGHTRTLWQLLKRYQIPVFLFINKMDQAGTDKQLLLKELQESLSENCIDFSQAQSESFYDSLAMCSEEAMEQFLEQGTIEIEEMQKLIQTRQAFPCFFGSALKEQGIDKFIEGIKTYSKEPVYDSEFGARVFKIARDEQGNRLTYLKITGGTLKVKTILPGQQEKINQIRIYSGEKYSTVEEAEAGTVCAVTGLSQTHPGEGFGVESKKAAPILEPVLTYQIELPEEIDAAAFLPKLRLLEEEEPELHIVWDEQLKEIRVQVMGEVQIEILKYLIQERFGIEVSFGTGSIVYKETIQNVVEGVGHFEPLRHYAEVHLRLEPGEPGSGLQFATECSEDLLSRNWQRLILTHLEEKEHKGVLIGAPITDIKITLTAGRAHQKHTEGGDFRQATYRAVRQGLKQAQSVLLEPYYAFRLEVPEGSIGRAMTDLERMCGRFETPQIQDGQAVLIGKAPVALLQDYQKEVTAYTKGEGRILCNIFGYGPCHNAEEVIAAKGYDSEADLANPTGSVFCAHGAGFVVSWDEVKNYMHLEDTLEQEKTVQSQEVPIFTDYTEDMWIDTEEIDAILDRTYGANKKEKNAGKAGYGKKRMPVEIASVTRTYQSKKSEEEYLLVDGYNVIHAWEELAELAEENLDGARGKLLDILCNYQGIRKCNLIVVFDAYRVKGHVAEVTDYHNIHVVFTAEAETADQYIEKFAHENGRKYRVTVATSDGLEQIIIRGQDCLLISARELKEEIKRVAEENKQQYMENQMGEKNRPMKELLEGLQI
ncbi:translation factor GTPase family protein [Roseburia sp. MSJ-14]|uniref:translation factor GTPase family protein n=1 Tax=Roseburia sp. MSJ-14 TaxID=2841514 RepID=UPI001C1271F7|nr:TetM/TetW/TetO/TetS family tetracycline resistance ribosomal protection protein [Roseburia sp. MSJ-14]MBU5472230.1 TetM/TetW/TetO/TetS family tetracycline resistance ribosomal protection protein [Roseburia sp. MSJ-14]